MVKVLNAADAAKYCGIARKTLYNLRYSDRGPKAYKHGRQLVYYPEDLDAWLKSELVAA